MSNVIVLAAAAPERRRCLRTPPLLPATAYRRLPRRAPLRAAPLPHELPHLHRARACRTYTYRHERPLLRPAGRPQPRLRRAYHTYAQRCCRRRRARRARLPRLRACAPRRRYKLAVPARRALAHSSPRPPPTLPPPAACRRFSMSSSVWSS